MEVDSSADLTLFDSNQLVMPSGNVTLPEVVLCPSLLFHLVLESASDSF